VGVLHLTHAARESSAGQLQQVDATQQAYPLPQLVLHELLPLRRLLWIWVQAQEE